ncbi:hypothetical protein SH1V18_15120 [Vallitalea longa]|uniref:Uncharacterized protein n=1 Tax=Vallitalea longa TaxID=2936439 RepID=A0A9W5Y8C6_9FIRM|nr:hypothetical protein [Vallitalea longa]GKX29032.1 hypothetical protein SH1V18_15120 [Vallitalea longa]
MNINIKIEGGYQCTVKHSTYENEIYHLTITKDGELIKSCSIGESTTGRAVEVAEMELHKTKFLKDNNRFIELFTILGANGMDLVEFIKNDLKLFKDCECLDGLADLIEEELSCANE